MANEYSGDNKPTFISVRFQTADLSFSPRNCLWVKGSSSGICLGNKDSGESSFHQIVLASVFRDTKDIQSPNKILLFVRGNRRPFLVPADIIRFSDFPDAAKNNLISSLRNLMYFFYEKNPEIIFDDNTRIFLDGKTPVDLSKDILVLSTALGKALDWENTYQNQTKINILSKIKTDVVQEVAASTPQTAAIQRGILSDEIKAPERRPQNAGLQIPILDKIKPAEDISHYDGLKSEKQVAENIKRWTDRSALYCAFFLLGGFLFPLLKPSILFQTTVFIWPWNTMGMGNNEVSRAAMATYSMGQNMVLWTLLPLMAGIITLIIRRFRKSPVRFIGLFGAGSVTFLLLIIALIRESEIFGIMFLPPTIAAGVMISLAVASAALIATANRTRKWFDTSKFLRIISGTGGTLLALFVIMPVLASSGEWRSWPMILLYFSIFFYAVMGIISASQGTANRLFLDKISFVSRISLIWLPFAALIAQASSNNPVVAYVIGSGGGAIHIFVSIVKAVLIYYGCVFLMTTGLVEFMAWLIIHREYGKEAK